LFLPYLHYFLYIKSLILTGSQIINCLENGVSQWPKLEGRFPQVSGISFAFDGSKPPGSRIDPQFIKIGDEYLHPDKVYRMATKAYLANGKDGYDVLAKCNQVTLEKNWPSHFQELFQKQKWVDCQ
jgi:5'-nucleotidase